VDATPSECLGGDGPTGRLVELFAAGGPQHGAAALADVRDAASAEFDDVVIEQALVAAADARHPDSVVHRGPHDCPDGRVHAWSVAAAGEYSDVRHAAPV